MGLIPFLSPISIVQQMAAIAETVWQYQQQYESALDAFFEFKATGKVASSGPKLDMDRVEKLEKENVELKASLAEVLKRLAALEGNTKQAAPAAGGDAEDEKLKAERIAAYNARKAAKEEKK